MEQRMIDRQIDDRKRVRRQHLADLVFPHLPGILAPEVVGPEKPAAEEVIAQMRGFVLVKVGVPHLGHHDERAL